MSEETGGKLKCLQIAAEASSRVGQYSPTVVLDQAKSWYEWVKEGSQETRPPRLSESDVGQAGDRSQNKTLAAKMKSSGKSRR